ncbi:MAG: NAD(P)/FAD-dependent oxidoreductase, partial [Deltaproteobacteria bacterium]|nr:NAD(P)/FAD-dependent oxidoreductase [Deltaproteobacteria bacterium]
FGLIDHPIPIGSRFPLYAVVAADGAASLLRRRFFPDRRQYLAGLQVEVPLRQPLNRTIVAFDPRWRMGYAWLFPKIGVANVGVGLQVGQQPNGWKILDEVIRFFQEAGLIGSGVLARSIGAIVVSGPERRLTCGRIVFAGDAAGLTHPITGAGIHQAVFSGRKAGEAAADFVLTGKTSAWIEYEKEVLGRYGRTLAWALKKRKLQEEAWDTDDFPNLIRKTWMAYHEYRH